MIKYLLCFLMLTSPCIAEIYKWTDEQGKVHFSDNADDAPHAEKVTVKINSYQHVALSNLDYDAGKTVKLFYADWCGFCKKAKRYFNAQGIPYVLMDIEKSPAAKREFDRLGGKGIPLILVGKKRMRGFSQKAFDKLYSSI